MSDIDFIKNILPGNYKIKQIKGGIDCISKEGIKDEETWVYLREAIRQHFGDRFKEIYHTTCTYHIHFTIYFESDTLTHTGG